MEKLKLVLKVIRYAIEEIWQVIVILWNLPVGLIELAWTALFNQEKFKYNINLLRELIRDRRNM